MAMANWDELITDAIKRAEGADSEVVGSTLTNQDAFKNFNVCYGSTEGCSFTAWTRDRVYFPICYDGIEWVGSAPRNPCDEKCEHQGGG